MDSKNKISSKIIGIQFSILSPDEIIRNSVAEITTKETYNGIKPKIGGLFDPRMGVLEPGMICPTDGQNHIDCPGYFGHIVLAKPVFYIQYLKTIQSILKCVCFKCSKLLISKEENEQLLNYSHSERWDKLFHICNNLKVRRCGQFTNNGCGCLQPKIKKQGYCSLYAEWVKTNPENKEEELITIKYTPELILKIFKKITDEDVDFMGFSHKWSRPEWMICQVFAVPPPSVRPSVKQDSQQRSEDDITHIIINIIKFNNSLREKLHDPNSNNKIIENWTSILQYYIATMVDNNIPGTSPVTQRSGRPLKSITERHKGKTGRVRGNLMGKRVDFSARSVITPDPELSINELGVPLRIAMNITKPVYVTNENKNYLLYLIKNGPDKYPGAKILEKKNGENISLRYVDTENIMIYQGDCVHRHMLNGDYVLFNRQPTLHRMSMMAHIVKVLHKGDTFRMNVADTKPYNADFDGDEMNMHMPQNDEAEMELKHLAAIPHQIISPANNNSIIGIFQDSLLGSYLITRDNVSFTRKEAMNLLEKTINPDISIFDLLDKETYSPHELISTILPGISLDYKKDDDNKTNSNHILIKNGIMKHGQLDKGVFGKSGKGLIQRIYNDYSCFHSQQFIDDIQAIVTEYMKTTGFSVGMSDLIASSETIEQVKKTIIDKKKQVSKLIDETHLGILDNTSGLSNKEYFEGEVNNILNEASKKAGDASMKYLKQDNRFVTIITCGSKGNELNMAQMISCLGQQNIENKRIPYSYQNRTLPHFKQFDDNPVARGFVESSFIGGLSPEELFFHAMGGRVGLIDTAVKTSTTGYIQRRLIKGLEDIQVCYDRTIRNNKKKIIQFSYGSTNMDTIHMENIKFDLLHKSMEDIFKMYHYEPYTTPKIIKLYMTKEAIKQFKQEKPQLDKVAETEIKKFIDERNYYIEHVMENMNDMIIYLPISFQQIIHNVREQFELNEKSLSNITPMKMYEYINHYYKDLEKVYKPCKLFKLAYEYYLNPFVLLFKHKMNEDTLIFLLEQITYKYKKSLVHPGEMVGMISAQSIGEPTTQMTLNTFHYAGVASKSNVTRGVPRMEELLTLTPNIKNPSLTIFMKEEHESNKEETCKILNRIQHLRFVDIVQRCEIYYNNQSVDDEPFMKYYSEELSEILKGISSEESEDNANKWILKILLDKSSMFQANITIQEIHFALKQIFNKQINCYYNDMNEENIIFNISLNNKRDKRIKDETDNIYMIKSFQYKLLNQVVLRGVENINKVNIREINDYLKYEQGDYTKTKIYVLDTLGTNLSEILTLDYIDFRKTFSNSIVEMKKVLGIEAARKCLFNEIRELMEFSGSYINHHHIGLLCDRMTYNEKMVSIFRHGINNDDIGPIAKASFEETTEMFLKAARHGEIDEMKGVSANVMCGQEGYYGTSAFSLYLNTKDIQELNEKSILEEKEKEIEMTIDKDLCSIEQIKIQHNLVNKEHKNILEDNNYEIDI
jgi:DNA-directed RNA polymerase II subunit RPB1